MPCRGARAAATSSWVDSGLEAASDTVAPPARRARTRIAVSAVTFRQAATDSPAKRWLGREPVAERGQHRHGPLGPFDPGTARVGQQRVGDVTDPGRLVVLEGAVQAGRGPGPAARPRGARPGSVGLGHTGQYRYWSLLYGPSTGTPM